MGKITVNLRVKQAKWLNPSLWVVSKLAGRNTISNETTSKWLSFLVNRSFKYRLNRGRWKRLSLDVTVSDIHDS